MNRVTSAPAHDLESSRDGEAFDGTTAGRVASAWLRANQELGCGLRSRDMAQLWDRFGEGERPRVMSVPTQTLVRRGILFRVESRFGSTRYVHRDAPPLSTALGCAPDLEPLLLAALAAAARKWQRFVSTREVTEELPAVGYVGPLDKALRTRLWQQLFALSTTKMLTGERDAASPAKVRMTTTMRSGAATSRANVYWWAPADSTWAEPHERTGATARSAVVALVEEARADLGRPVSAREFELYVRWSTHTGSQAASMLKTHRLADALQSARLDSLQRRTRRKTFGLLAHETPFSAGRLIPVRLSGSELSEDERAAMAFVDAMAVLRPSREHALLDAVLANAAVGTTLAGDLVSLRRIVLRQQFEGVTPEDQWLSLIELQRRALSRMGDWVAVAPTVGPGSATTRRWIDTLAVGGRDLEVMSDLATRRRQASPARFAGMDGVRVIANAPSMSFDDLQPLHDGLVTLQRGRPGVHPIFRHARRVGCAKPEGWRPGPGQVPTFERLDRVDAYALAVEHVGAPETSALVGDGVMLLGMVLRDERIVQAAIEGAGPGDDWIVCGLLVALGLLGVHPDPARWTHRPDFIRAGVLGTALADPPGAVAALRGVIRAVPAHCRSVVADALAQAEAGEWLALLG